jgi:4-amino-4-deoxy-L-arabinose transferase-like glycosyltransferase
MNRLTRIAKSSYCAIAACSLFLVTGWFFLARLGVQNDEALFANGIYKPYAVAYVYQLGHSRLPLMLMSYLGTLKSWVYRPIFQLFGAGTKAMRAPMLLAGAASVWVFYLLLKRLAGNRAAVVGCGLLAADSLYLLTVCFDWGPVALQHLLLVSGMLCLVIFYQDRKSGALAAGAFLLGLAMWDKALAVWMLGGIGVASVLIIPRQILAVLTVRRTALAAVAFGLGALPLIVFNSANRGVTFRSNASWETNGVAGKARLLRATAEGSALFGWLNFEDWETAEPRAAQGAIESASAKISALGGHVRHSLLFYGFVLALLLTPLARGSDLRLILFALVAMIVAWAQMAVTVNAGGSVHHAILIWPLPQIVIAVAFAAASRRLGTAGIPALAAVLAVMMISSLLVTNEYFRLIVRNGGSKNWTDAIYPLATYMNGDSPERVYCVDWGILDSLRLLSRGRLPLAVGTDPINKARLNDEDRQFLDRMISSPQNIFVNHTPEFEFFTGVNDKLVRFAADTGYRREVLTEIADRNGRPVYQVYRFVHAESAPDLARR